MSKRKGKAYIVGETGPELFRSMPHRIEVEITGDTEPLTKAFSFPNYRGSRKELVKEIRAGFTRAAYVWLFDRHIGRLTVRIGWQRADAERQLRIDDRGSAST